MCYIAFASSKLCKIESENNTIDIQTNFFLNVGFVDLLVKEIVKNDKFKNTTTRFKKVANIIDVQRN